MPRGDNSIGLVPKRAIRNIIGVVVGGAGLIRDLARE